MSCVGHLNKGSKIGNEWMRKEEWRQRTSWQKWTEMNLPHCHTLVASKPSHTSSLKSLEGEKKILWWSLCSVADWVNHISGGETQESVFPTNCLTEFNASKCSAGQCWWWVSTLGAHWNHTGALKILMSGSHSKRFWKDCPECQYFSMILVYSLALTYSQGWMHS